MALTFGTPVVDTTGLYVTVPIVGSTLPLTTPLNGPHFVSGFDLKIGGNSVQVDFVEANPSTANVYIIPRAPIATGTTVTIDADASNLTDSAATASPITTTAIAVTNSSTFNPTPGSNDENEVGITRNELEKARFQNKTGVVLPIIVI